MTINRRNALKLTGALAAWPLIGRTHSNAAALPRTDAGLHTQPWFANTFLDLKEDLAEAAAGGKRLVIFWEQPGCPYCGEMHRVNLADKEIASYIQKNFLVLQLNLYGSREVTDFDGKTMEERQLARRWRVNFTPTLTFFPPTVAEVAGKNGRDAESWRLLGYWKPFHFLSTFVYVRQGANKTQPNFQSWLSKYADKLRAEGKTVKLW